MRYFQNTIISLLYYLNQSPTFDTRYGFMRHKCMELSNLVWWWGLSQTALDCIQSLPVRHVVAVYVCAMSHSHDSIYPLYIYIGIWIVQFRVCDESTRVFCIIIMIHLILLTTIRYVCIGVFTGHMHVQHTDTYQTHASSTHVKRPSVRPIDKAWLQAGQDGDPYTSPVCYRASYTSESKVLLWLAPECQQQPRLI